MTQHHRLQDHGRHRLRPAFRIITRCACGKIRYATRHHADLVLATMDRTDPARGEDHSYRCATCSGWHLTSWTPAEYKAYRTAITAPPPTREDPRGRLDLSSIHADLAAVPTPAEVAARTGFTWITSPSPDGAIETAPQNIPSPVKTGATAGPVVVDVIPQRVCTPEAPVTPRRAVPTPAEVAARTVPIKRAEAARRRAELTANSLAAQSRTARSTATIGTRLRALLNRLMRRIHRS
ncbi:hypothetical protein ACIP5Y_42315 [Nocardia sp. NPDC088792]|uniref:hypothetical protein n=1 Tax=Nocardia sp. NPDC088792 TaxID=3364332 RepID=UPI003801AB17